MRWLFSILLLGLLCLASAVSTTGNRLLVVLDDIAEKENYGRFFGDLKGTSCNFTLCTHLSYLPPNYSSYLSA